MRVNLIDSFIDMNFIDMAFSSYSGIAATLK